MARHASFALTISQTTAANVARREIVELANNGSLTVTYVKRDGTVATISGPVLGIVGRESTEAVTLDTAKGPRSANLYNVKAVAVTPKA